MSSGVLARSLLSPQSVNREHDCCSSGLFPDGITFKPLYRCNIIRELHNALAGDFAYTHNGSHFKLN